MAEALDIEKLVGEMELAVDRLRSLYEQYFMGIEKLEPTVPRKDLDRRIQVLRKEQIRNTAQRFRFQMILQRYNTYQTHWQRICREIENGTYKRHVMRAQQRFAGEGAAPRRRESVRPPAPQVLPKDLADELAELDREFAAEADIEDLDLELVEDPPPRAPAPSPPPARPSQPGPLWRKVGAAAGPPPAARSLPQPSVTPPRPGGPPPRPAPPGAPPARPPIAAAPRAPTAAPRVPEGGPRPPAAAPAPPPAVARPPAAAPPARAPMASSPLMPRPASPAAPAVPATSPRPAGPPRAQGDLPDERVRQIYAQYVDAKRKQNESTATITYEAVAKSLRDSSARLREKHGKAVDFEVAVKDGKAILKPVIK